MGWKSARSQRKKRHFGKRRHAWKGNGNDNGTTGRSRYVENQKIVGRLLKKAAEGAHVNPFRKIFGTMSPQRALSIAFRIKRLKKRDPDIPMGAPIKPSRAFPKEVRIVPPKLKCGRHKKCGCKWGLRKNVHHLTPQKREGERYFGNFRCNFLLMRISRHESFHKEFGVRTWEEVIVILARCVNIDQQEHFDLLVDHFHQLRRLPLRACRRLAVWAMRELRFANGSGTIRSHSFGAIRSNVGPLGIEPSLPAPKAGVLPVYDGPKFRPFKVFYFSFRIKPTNALSAFAPVA